MKKIIIPILAILANVTMNAQVPSLGTKPQPLPGQVKSAANTGVLALPPGSTMKINDVFKASGLDSLLGIKNAPEPTTANSSTNLNPLNLSPQEFQELELRALHFLSNSNASIPVSSFQNLKAMTIEAWVKNEGGTEKIQAIVSSAGLNFAHLQASDEANVNCAAYVNNEDFYFPAIPKSTGNWQHVALVVQSGNSQLYINGTPYGPKITRTFSAIKPASSLLIGRGLENGRAFHGKIANVKIWNRAKSAEEVMSEITGQNQVGTNGLLYYSPTSNPQSISSAGDCIPVPVSATSGLQSVTIEGWVKSNGTTSSMQAIVSSTGPEFVHFQTASSGNIAVYLNDGRALMLPVLPPLSPGWHHVALVVASGNSQVFLDGNQIGATDKTTFTGLKDSNSVFVGKGWEGGRVFKGNIADIRIWKNRVLTQQQLRDYSHTPPPSNATGLVFHMN